MMLTDKSLWLTTTGALALGMLAPAALAQDAAIPRQPAVGRTDRGVGRGRAGDAE